MAISPYIARLRQMVGTQLLVLPSVAVLPRDERGWILFVRLIDSGQWATIGGAVEPDESPEQAALREAREEAGVTLQLDPVRAVLGGPEYRVTYPNGDVTSYVAAVFDAKVMAGTPRADGDETSEVAWLDPNHLPLDQMGSLTKALLRDAGVGRPGV
jgi:8-oxo-dGTP pyrophosphatase MutT (NUDIX family)